MLALGLCALVPALPVARAEDALLTAGDDPARGAVGGDAASRTGAGDASGGELSIAPAVSLDRYATTPLAGVEVRCDSDFFCDRVALRSVQKGSPPSGELVRRGLRELESTGRFARMRVELIDTPRGPLLRYVVTPRRLVRKVVVSGGSLGSDAHQRALTLRPEDEVTEQSLAASQEQLRRAYERAGYSQVTVTAVAEPTDDELEVVIRVNVDEGPASRIVRVDVRVLPSPHHPRLTPLLGKVGVARGQRLDLDAIEEARSVLAEELIAAHFVDAQVELVVTGRVVTFLVRSGPWVTVRTEGAQSFDNDRLVRELDSAIVPDVRGETLAEALRAFYMKNGFLDVSVKFRVDEARSGLTRQYVGVIQEGERVLVTERRFPCRGETKSRRELDRELDGVLEENFPGVAVVHPVDGGTLDRGVGTPSATPAPAPLAPAVYGSYSAEVYEKAVLHLRDLYRSDGYLEAEVGPATLVRRACARNSAPGECIPVGGLPGEDSCEATVQKKAVVETCEADLPAGRRCEPSATLVLPIHPGPRAMLYDVVFRGNTQRTAASLLDIADFPLGEPARLTVIERGLERIREEYLEEGYAFVAVDSELELSPDRTRARLVVEIAERQKVIVSRIVVVGSTRTREPLVRRRLSIHEGQPLRKSAIERSQRQVESLGVFTSVSIGMQDPNVPSAEKVVVVSVIERMPQYLDIKGGIATADGFRVGFEYGHRNLGASAIALTLRSQLGIRPIGLIPEADVREKYATLDGAELLERRNSLTIGFPETGLGPLFRLEVEGLDVRDNNRDFGQTRDAGVVRLLFRPTRDLFTQVGATVERNDAQIIGTEDQREGLEDYARDNPVRVPEGVSLAITQNWSGAWDRRDRPLAATRGTYVGLGVEHVNAVPVDQPTSVCLDYTGDAFGPVCSELLRWTARVAGYIPLNEKGLSIAISLKGGIIQHLTDDSRTYPDRLFFMGGVDTIRGYPQDSLVPQDIADQVLDPTSGLTIDDVVLRGGDVFINPRIELRIPLVGSVQTALFLDAGNLWTSPEFVDLLELRYALGTGLRVDTPVGPLVFDYGFNLERVVDGFYENREGERDWEDIGAFHFSIGLF